MYNLLHSITWSKDLNKILVKDANIDNLKNCKVVGVDRFLQHKLPYTAEFFKKVTSLVMLDVDTKSILVIKTRFEFDELLERNDLTVLREVEDFKRPNDFEGCDVVIPFSYNRLLY